MNQNQDQPQGNASPPPPDILSTHRLGMTYQRGSHFSRHPPVDALRDVTLNLAEGEILGIIGPSGCGKSTLARCLALYEPPTTGHLLLRGRDPWRLSDRQRRRLRPLVQLVAQSPAAALDPRFDVHRVLAEPLRYALGLPTPAMEERVDTLLRRVDLDPSLRRRRCQELSGGQKQRLVLARALAAEPRVIVFDEALAAVDNDQRRQLTDLLGRLQRSQGLTYLWISHDLKACSAWADRILVIEAGRIVEEATPQELLTRPQQGITRALVEAL